MDTSNNNNSSKDWMVLSSDTIMNGFVNNQNTSNNNNNNNNNGTSTSTSGNNEFSLNRSNTVFNNLISQPSNLNQLLQPNTQPSLGTLLKQESNLMYNTMINDDSWSNLLHKSSSSLNNQNNQNNNNNGGDLTTSFMSQHQQNVFNNIMNNMSDFHNQSQQQMNQHQSPTNTSNLSTSLNPYVNTSRNIVINNTSPTSTTTSTTGVVNYQGANTFDEDEEDNNIGDDIERCPTPPTPQAEPIPWGNTSSNGSNGTGLFKSTFSTILGNIPMDSIASVPPPSEYESPSKFQRTNTVDITNQIYQYSNYPVSQPTQNININFLEQHTSRLNSETQMIQRSSSDQNRSFIMSHYDTGTVPISSDYYNSLLLRFNNRPDMFLAARDKQKIVLATHNMALADELHQLYTTMKKDIEEENSELRNLLSIRILEPVDLKKIREAIEGLKSHLRIVDVLSNELRYVTNKKRPECCVGLILTQQPSSQVIFRGGKGITETFKVKLITGVIEPDSISSITASIDKRETSNSASSSKKEKASDSKSQASLENAEAPLSPLNQECEFKNLKINVSTRMTPSHLKFSATYRDSSSKGEKHVVSYPSSPLVVITNESQWAEAAGKLLISDAFGDKDEISWELFANVLHTHILKVTNQDQEIKRKLRSWEFDYIQKNYFYSKPTISKSECKTFWSKFGAILQSIHFKRHIASLWHNGLIYGLITKNECNAHLMSLPEGSFLIRFSDSVPGSFAVAYVTNDENDRVKHYLVKPDDIGANKSLPDFLRERYQFKTLYIVDPAKRSLSPKTKEDCFMEYYSKNKVKNVGNPGYVSGL